MLLSTVPLPGQVCSARTSLSLPSSIILRDPKAILSWPQPKLSKTMSHNKLLYKLIHRLCYINGKLTNTAPKRKWSLTSFERGSSCKIHTEIRTVQRGLAWLLCSVAHRIHEALLLFALLGSHTVAHSSEQLHANLKQLKVLLHLSIK